MAVCGLYKYKKEITTHYVGKTEALEHCIKYFTYIRHYSFSGNEYIKNNGKVLVWNDGSKVDVDELPNDKGYGKYFSEIHNLCSF